MLTLPHSHACLCLPRSRAAERQKETDDLGLSTQCKEDKQQYHTDFILPCPYLSGRRHPRVAKPAWVLSPVMEVEMKRHEGEAEGKRDSVSVMTLEAEVVSFVGLLSAS